jgi:hypothetical protein
MCFLHYERGRIRSVRPELKRLRREERLKNASPQSNLIQTKKATKSFKNKLITNFKFQKFTQNSKLTNRANDDEIALLTPINTLCN